jgi:hypothetical protein
MNPSIFKIKISGTASISIENNILTSNDKFKTHIEDSTLYLQSLDSSSMIICGNNNIVSGNNINGDLVVGQINNCDNNSNLTFSFGSNGFKINGKSFKDLFKKNEDILSEPSEDGILTFDLTDNIIEIISLSGTSSLNSGLNSCLTSLRKIKTSGTASLILSNLNVDSLEVKCSGTSNIKLTNFNGETLSVTASGVSEFKTVNSNFKNIQKNKSGVASIIIN